ncbi:unnamed protein product, partial [Closterium sp. NIES-65]
TKLMTPERRRAIWAIYVWCRRTDELVDGPNASHITPRALDRWEERLDELFQGRPYDMLDAALSDTIQTFPMSIQPYRDMVDGMRMDLRKSRYRTFDELYVYCYNVAGTVGLMSVPVMGIDPKSKAPVEDVYKAALDLGIANQLTNILRDVGEDAQRGRVYLPQDELAQFGLSDDDIFEGKVTDNWRNFMKFQIERARNYFKTAEAGVVELDSQSRWPVGLDVHLALSVLSRQSSLLLAPNRAAEPPDVGLPAAPCPAAPCPAAPCPAAALHVAAGHAAALPVAVPPAAALPATSNMPAAAMPVAAQHAAAPPPAALLAAVLPADLSAVLPADLSAVLPADLSAVLPVALPAALPAALPVALPAALSAALSVAAPAAAHLSVAAVSAVAFPVFAVSAALLLLEFHFAGFFETGPQTYFCQ